MTTKKKGFNLDAFIKDEDQIKTDLFEEARKDREVEANNPQLKRRGRPTNKDLIWDNASQSGLTKDFTRASYIMPVELVDFIADYAYTERIPIKDAVARLITIGKKQIEKEYKKEGKELLRKEKK